MIETRPWLTSLSTRKVPGVIVCDGFGHGRRGLALERPVREERVELRGHLGLLEVARGGDEHVLRVDPLPVEGDEVVPREPLERRPSSRSGSGRSRRRRRGTQRSRRSMSAELVVPLLHVGEELVLAELELVVLEAGLGEDLAQDREPLVEVLREEVERRRCRGRRRSAAVELGGEEGEALLEVLGLAVLRSAAREEVAGQLGEPFLAGRVRGTCRP